MNHFRILLVLLAIISPAHLIAGAKDGADANGFYWDWGSFERDCAGDCALSIMGGR